MSIKVISRQRFEALSFMRLGRVKLISEEQEWYTDDNENVLGVVILDKPDQDWLYVILGRDEVARFRAIDQDINFKTVAEARTALTQKMEEYARAGENMFPQGLDQKNQKTFQIFEPLLSQKLLHQDFIVLAESNGYSPAREILKEIAYTFVDTDGNYIQQFQTNGFDARLWELYLYAVLHEMDYEIDRSYQAPDYMARNIVGQIVLEATTANAAPPLLDMEARKLKDIQLEDYVAIRLGSPLFSKLNKRYWDQAHVKGHPFILAVADFRRHETLSFCAPYLMHYLYGIRQNETADGGTYSPIKKHTFEGKTIPSGFFNLPDAENISAVLFSDSGTIAKFNRMGRVAGFGDPSIIMARVGERFSRRDSERPEAFRVLVDEQYQERWSEGIWIFHNPQAKHPLPMESFSDVAHVRLEKGEFQVYLNDAFPTWSKTLIFGSGADWEKYVRGGGR